MMYTQTNSVLGGVSGYHSVPLLYLLLAESAPIYKALEKPPNVPL